MSFLKIICPRPGYRRTGIAHEAVRIWPVETFSGDQIHALRADPLLTVTDLTAEEAEAEWQAQPVTEVASSPDVPASRKTVTDVLRLLMPEASEPLLVQTSSAVLNALAGGTSPAAFRAIAEEIFRAHAQEAAAGESAPPAADEQPPGPATETVPPAAPPDADAVAETKHRKPKPVK